MPINPGLQFPRLYNPETVAELLTEKILGKLMLGFTAALYMPVALGDRTNRYDLFGNPKDHFCEFCRTIRSEKFGLDDKCKEWDKKVADILLGEKPEEYPGQLKKFEKLFLCHAKMIDVAELIHLAGRRFAVLHGGQVKPTDSNWRKEMKNRLKELLPNRAEDEIDELLSLVENMPQDSKLLQRDKAFREFARELETVLELSYQQRRAATEESILKAVLESLTYEAIADWQTWWSQLDQVLTKLCVACKLSRIAFLVGKSSKSPFEVGLKSASSQREIWGGAEVKVGSYWEVIRHKPMLVETQTWSKAFRDCLSISSDEPCALTTFTCRVGTPASSMPGVVVWIGAEVKTQGMLEFLGKLTTEISRNVTMVCNKLELYDVREKSSAAAAYGAHDVIFPLHAAFQLAERNRRALTRLKIQDPEMITDADELNAALREAGRKAEPIEKLPLRDLNIQCVFQSIDVIPVIDRTISLAQRVGEDRGISVKWVKRPTEPVIINADEAYLSTAFHTIFDNAVKYSFDQKEVRVFGTIEESQFVLRVSNFGVGIPPEEEFSLFEFGERAEIEDDYRGKTRRGAGLGLAISYRIIKAHGGDIYLRSVPSEDRMPKNDYLSYEVSAYIHLPLHRKS